MCWLKQIYVEDVTEYYEVWDVILATTKKVI